MQAFVPWWILHSVKPEGPEKRLVGLSSKTFTVEQQEKFSVAENGDVLDKEKHEAALKALNGTTDIKNHYDLVTRLGVGAQGATYQAIEKKSGRIVAVKERRNFWNGRCVGSVIRNVWENASHPNIVRIFAIFANTVRVSLDSKIYVVMELCRGGDLFNVMAYCRKEFNGITHKFVASCMKQTMQGITYLHSEFKASHNDIKPENVLLERKPMSPNDFPRCVVADFGCMESEYGDWRYAAPELWAPEHVVSGIYTSWVSGVPRSYATDVWSLGVMFFEMLSGGYLPYVDSPNVSGWAAFMHVDQLKEGILHEDPDGRITGLEPHWHRIEENVDREASSPVPLVKSMLQRKACNRVSLGDAMEHPWFKDTFDIMSFSLSWGGDTIIVTNMAGQDVSSVTGFNRAMSYGELRSKLQSSPLCDDTHAIEEFVTKSGRSIDIDEPVGEVDQVLVTVREKFGVAENSGTLDHEKPKLHAMAAEPEHCQGDGSQETIRFMDRGRVADLREKVRTAAEAKAMEAGLITDQFESFEVTYPMMEWKYDGGDCPGKNKYSHVTSGGWKERLWKVKVSEEQYIHVTILEPFPHRWQPPHFMAFDGFKTLEDELESFPTGTGSYNLPYVKLSGYNLPAGDPSGKPYTLPAEFEGYNLS